MEIIVIGVFIAFLAILMAVSLVRRDDKASKQLGSYSRRSIMTENEKEFFGRLVVALPDHYIFPQVAMGALLKPASSDKARAHSDRLRVAQQRVDFIVCDRQCEIIAAIELDDRTHSTAKDATRDARLAQAGIRTVRFQSRSKPNPTSLREAILMTKENAPSASAPQALAMPAAQA